MDLLGQRLQRLGIERLPEVNSKNLDACFCQWEKQQSPDIYHRFILDNAAVNLEYALVKSQLALDIKGGVASEEMARRLVFVFILAQRLEYIHFFYLKSPKDVRRFRLDQECYLRHLKALGYNWSEIEKKAELAGIRVSLSQKIRETTSTVNWPRLLLIRIKRLLEAIAALSENYKVFKRFVLTMNKFSKSTLAYLAWAFYVPRLAVNIFLIWKHLFPGFWMEEEEKSLGWWLRLKIQLSRRWFELANDSAWSAVGLINCFILIGTLSPAAVYVTVALYAFDVFLAIVRAYVELNRLQGLKKQYVEMGHGLESDEQQNELQAYQQRLNAKIKYERLRLGLSVATTASLFAAMCLTLPFFAAITPLIPLVGVSLVVAVCLLSYVLGKLFERCKPDEKIPEFNKAASMGRASTMGLFARQQPQRLCIDREGELSAEEEIKRPEEDGQPGKSVLA